VGGFAALGADQVRDVERETAQLLPRPVERPNGLGREVAGLLDAVLGDRELRAELLERGHRRLVAYDETTTARALRDAIERVVAVASAA
jgi:hypothetical protein